MKKQLFWEYFEEWIELYKSGAVRPVTFAKYQITLRTLKKLAPHVTLDQLDRKLYQKIINEYAQNHEHQTVIDFNRHLKSSLVDALDDELIKRDPTRKVVIKGTISRNHKKKYLSQKELIKLMRELEIGPRISWDYLILLVAKTGLRFSEALGLTAKDFDFEARTLNVNKTWDYKSKIGNFIPTKNDSSIRKIPIDSKLNTQFKRLTKKMDASKPIFIQEQQRIFNSTINNRLEVLCSRANIPVISVHGLRHTHASVLLYAGVSIASVARRLGHSSITTTQETYLHVIRELDNQDNDKIIKYISTLK
ncbi:tyrosine-type recombinase/integrase [Lactobacillus sp. ESL0785]|uniref:site-specific integrase n=1 Tax=Lactobacillus sp. ESL0785 TaxID=2983232 RepID=UPI0023F92E14|nr:site-specific integrase [Lactobacillus sp. ESL0785]WEV70369.1 tyrosine-type recombinase/integrase [Lactobacillus sp. ESL0785]